MESISITSRFKKHIGEVSGLSTDRSVQFSIGLTDIHGLDQFFLHASMAHAESNREILRKYLSETPWIRKLIRIENEGEMYHQTNGDGTCRFSIEVQSHKIFKETMTFKDVKPLDYSNEDIRIQVNAYFKGAMAQKGCTMTEEGKRDVANFLNYVNSYEEVEGEMNIFPADLWPDNESLGNLGQPIYNKTIITPEPNRAPYFGVEWSSLYSTGDKKFFTLTQIDEITKNTDFWWCLNKDHYFFSNANISGMLNNMEARDNEAQESLINQILRFFDYLDTEDESRSQHWSQKNSEGKWACLLCNPNKFLWDKKRHEKSTIHERNIRQKNTVVVEETTDNELDNRGEDSQNNAGITAERGQEFQQEAIGSDHIQENGEGDNRRRNTSGETNCLVCKRWYKNYDAHAKTAAHITKMRIDERDRELCDTRSLMNHLPAYPRSQTTDINLLQIPTTNIGQLYALAKQKRHMSKKEIHLLRKIMTKYMERIAERPSNEIEYKKLFLTPIILFGIFQDEAKDKGLDSMEKRANLLVENNWNDFKLKLFKGRGKGKEVGGTRVLENEEDQANTEQLKKEKQLQSDIREFEKIGRPLNKYLSEIKSAPRGNDTFEFLEMKFIHGESKESQMHGSNTISIDPDDVNEAIKNLKSDRSSSIDILLPENLKALAEVYKSKNEKSGEATRFLNAYTYLISMAINGRLPKNVATFWASTEGNAVRVNAKTRPIGKPTTWSKTADQLINKIVLPTLLPKIDTAQLGMSKSGNEIAIHSTRFRQETELSNLQEGDNIKMMVKSDSKDAFQHIHRRKLEEGYEKLATEILPYLRNNGIVTSKVQYFGCNEGVTSIECTSGVVQGRTNSSLTYCIGSYEYVDNIRKILDSSGGHNHIVSICDDITYMGSVGKCCDVLHYTGTEGMDEFGIVDNKDKFSVLLPPIVNQSQREEIQQRLEVEFNLKKTSIKIHPDDPSLQEDMHAKHQARVEYGFIISGAPVGSDEYVYAFLDNIIQQATEDCRKIQQLTDKQLAYVSLQQCLVTRFNYIFRTTPTSLLKKHGFFNSIKSIVIETMCYIAEVDKESIQDLQWQLMLLPISEGGLGMGGLTEEVAQAAYTASFSSALKHMSGQDDNFNDLITQLIPRNMADNQIEVEGLPTSVGDFIHNINTLAAKGATIDKEGTALTLHNLLNLTDTKGLQAQLSKLFLEPMKVKAVALLNEDSPYHEKIYNSMATGPSSAFLSAIPRTKTLEMAPHHFGRAIRKRLFIKEPGIDGTQMCKCSNKVMDEYGYHAGCCSAFSKERNAKHNTMVDLFAKLFQAASIQVIVEPRHMFRDEDNRDNKRPDIRTTNPIEISPITTNKEILDRTSNPRIAAFDFTAVSAARTIETTYVGRAALPGVEAKRAETLKFLKYSKACSDTNTNFIPIGFENEGYMGANAEMVIKLCVKRICSRTSAPYSSMIRYWRQRISVTLQSLVAEQEIKAIKTVLNHHINVYTSQSQIPAAVRETYRTHPADIDFYLRQ